MRSLAENIGRDPHAASVCSIRDLAAASHTSASTVVRFCRKLGYDGYKEFQRELVYELASTDDTNDIAFEDIVPGDAAEHVLRKVMQSNMRSMEATSRLIDPVALGVASSEPMVRSGAMGSRLSQLPVVDALFALYVTRDYERCTKMMLRNFDEKKPEGVTSA